MAHRNLLLLILAGVCVGGCRLGLEYGDADFCDGCADATLDAGVDGDDGAADDDGAGVSCEVVVEDGFDGGLGPSWVSSTSGLGQIAVDEGVMLVSVADAAATARTRHVAEVAAGAVRVTVRFAAIQGGTVAVALRDASIEDSVEVRLGGGNAQLVRKDGTSISTNGVNFAGDAVRLSVIGGHAVFELGSGDDFMVARDLDGGFFGTRDLHLEIEADPGRAPTAAYVESVEIERCAP